MSSLPEQTTPEHVVRDTIPIQPVPQATSRVRHFIPTWTHQLIDSLNACR